MKRLSLITLLVSLVFLFTSTSGSNMNIYQGSNSCSMPFVKDILYASSVNCSEWSIQLNGCYERVCCCDSSGRHFCERCCPDKEGKCIPSKVSC